MKLVFTQYVRFLAENSEPSSELFEELWVALRSALRVELKRHGLWTSPPAYVGVVGCPSWSSSAGASEGTLSGLEELLADCYEFIFLTRLRSLQAHLKLKENVEGLVLLNVRHFLFERQLQHDPLGFRVFQTLRRAVRQSIEAGWLVVESGDPRVRNQTLLKASGSEIAEGQSAPPELARLVSGWSQTLLPDLVTARGKAHQDVVTKLADHLHGLPEMGFRRFCFKDVVDPLKRGVRAGWAAALERESGESGFEYVDADFVRLVKLAWPDTGAEDRESFRQLVRDVMDRVDHSPEVAKERLYLRTLLEFLSCHANDGPLWDLFEKSAPHAAEPAGDILPSRRRIAARLEIPRGRLPGLYHTLGRFVVEVRRDQSSPKPVMKSWRNPREA